MAELDCLDLLIADHNRVRGLFKRFEQAKEAEDLETCAVLGATMAEELHVHTTIEEERFYPWVRSLDDELGEVVDEGFEEHHVVKVLLEEIGALEPGDEWLAKWTVVIENVEHHAEEEEKEMFPKVRSSSDATARKDMAQQLETGKRELGAPVLADKIDLSTDALQELARAQEIPGRSSMSHDELAATVAPG